MLSSTQKKLLLTSSPESENDAYERFRNAIRNDFGEDDRNELERAYKEAWHLGNIGTTENFDLLGLANYLKSHRANPKFVDAFLSYVLQDGNDSGGDTE